MRRHTLALSMLLLIVTAAPLMRSCGLAVGIVLLYGLLLKLIQTTNGGTRGRILLAGVSAGILAVPAGALMVLWGRAVGLSLPWSLIAWSAIIVAGAACGRLAAWCERDRHAATVARLSALPA